MWPFWLLAIAVSIVGTSCWWKKRCRLLENTVRRVEAEKASLLEQQQTAESEAEAREFAVCNSMVEGVLLLNAQGRVSFTNHSFNQLLGLQQDIRGRTLLEAFRHEALQQIFDRVRREGQVLNQELEFPGADRRWIQINATTLQNRLAQTQGMIFVCRDLTRLKQLENTRREFVANVSHELRTPLSMIKGYAETLISGAKDDPAVATRFLQTIEKHADRLTYLIEDLLTLSRLESGQVVMNTQELALRPLVEEALADLQLWARDRQASLANRVPPDLFVRADADRLQQVLFNLLDNAIRHGRPQGSAEILARPLDDQRVEVSVRDDGPGMPSEALERIFERFYRVDKGRSREQGGTGLGLAIVKHIVQAHGGEVWAESEPGRGATFYFTLPKA